MWLLKYLKVALVFLKWIAFLNVFIYWLSQHSVMHNNWTTTVTLLLVNWKHIFPNLQSLNKSSTQSLRILQTVILISTPDSSKQNESELTNALCHCHQLYICGWWASDPEGQEMTTRQASSFKETLQLRRNHQHCVVL